MTQNKSLKRRVRERMSKTGERYTAARRQVLAKAPTQAPAADQAPTEAPATAEALHGRTDRMLSEWFTLLDAWGARDRSHTDIARWLNTEQGVDAWWSQDITVRYEKHIGRRVLGQRGKTFSGTATKTIGVPAAVARSAWTDEAARARWLPNYDLRQRPNRAKVAARFDADVGRVVASFEPRGETKVAVAVEHEKLPDAETAQQLSAFWRERLVALKELLEA